MDRMIWKIEIKTVHGIQRVEKLLHYIADNIGTMILLSGKVKSLEDEIEWGSEKETSNGNE